jgi:putative tricarboxylic transport membrane protein
MEEQQQGRAVGSMRAWEIGGAVFFLIIGAIVVYDSRRLGSGWAPDGPQAGYFPFYIGVIIIVSSIVTLIGAINSGAKGDQAFVYRDQMKGVLSILVPSIVYVALINNPVFSLGIYEASAIFIAFFMRWLGKYGWGKIAAVALGVVTAFFLMFEVWFKVPLPKGPIENLLGFN